METTGSTSRIHWTTAVALSVLALLCYLAPLHSWAGDDIGGDTSAAQLMPIAILRYHSLDFTALLKRHPELLNEGELPFYFQQCRGRIVSFYPIVPGLLNVPCFMVANAFGLDLFRYRFLLSFFTAALECAASVGFMFVALEAAFPRKTAIGFAIVYALGTAVWSEASRAVWQHASSLLLLSAVFAVILRLRGTRGGADRWLPFAGFLLGLEVWNRPSSALIALPLAVFVWHKHRDRALGFSVGAAGPLMLMAVYSFLFCNSIRALGQGRDIVTDVTTPESGFQGRMLHGLLGVLLNPNRGLLVFDPIFVPALAILAVSFFSRTIPVLYRYLAVATALTLLCYSRWWMWWGGWCFSYRLLIELVPILILALALAWQRWISGRRLATWCFGISLFYSFGVHFLGAFYYPASQFDSSPDSIDEARIWNVRDGELMRDGRLFVEDLRRIATGHFPLPSIPWPVADPKVIDWSLDNDASSLPVRSGPEQPPTLFVLAGPGAGGSLDLVDPYSIQGWAYDPDQPDQPIAITIFDNGAPLISFVANVDRPDLAESGLGDGRHGFAIRTPPQLADGGSHQVSARVVGSNNQLNFSPKSLP
jgi:hypothetical protein